MKKIIIFTLLLFAIGTGYSKVYTITNSGFSFSPSTLTINLGDTVNFSLASIHNAVEVDQSTWNANGNTSNGGFSTADGGGMVIITSPGIHYYVCFYHASMGMKGTITVNSTTAIEFTDHTVPANYLLLQNYPNPFNPSTVISYALPFESKVSLRIYDLLGKQLLEPINKVEPAGFHNINFHPDNLASGIYFYRIDAVSADGLRKFNATRKMIILK